LKLSRDGWTGLAVLAASLVLLGFTLGLRDNPLVPIGPGFYPRIVLVITAVLSGWVLVQSFWQPARAAKGEENYRLVGIVFAIFFLYVGALPFLGFRIATLFFVPALQVTLDYPKDRKGWVIVAATALITTLVSYVLFEHYLQVLLPRGRWTDF
jgi:putative tricarboxylic transport membrane protein